MEICSVNVVEQNPLPKRQTKPFYIGTKEAPSGFRGAVESRTHITEKMYSRVGKILTVPLNTTLNIFMMRIR